MRGLSCGLVRFRRLCQSTTSVFRTLFATTSNPEVLMRLRILGSLIVLSIFMAHYIYYNVLQMEEKLGCLSSIIVVNLKPNPRYCNA
ncbi:hypothetical protein M430DRAFT_179562 [Amorphotheca resinae ATCC 22711]|uniref:Uncharacterized protein n=1 Tax=Amorphotheca resinae ATCC 22711 TaxID=857342 RepID=A0A2T3ATN1_AMORE|nr:hypothetical protein M430DRAFT_179562 [Amorphotheca resinae ATCC 22711]PSS10823.1 hypothetical protein M430DRAFT_179562 [Amorphotheca resinae ATCC 22711]